MLVSRDLDGQAPWVDAGERISLGRLAAAAAETGRSVPEVAARLAAYGFGVPDPASLPERLDDIDITLVSRNLDGKAPWLDAGERIPLGHLAAAAAETGRSVPEIAARLAAYGFGVPDPALLPERVDRDDVMLVSRNLDGKAPWVDAGERVSLGRLAAAAAETGWSVPEVAARLAAYGFGVPDPALLPERVDRDDVMLVSRNLDGKAPWEDAGERVSLGRLVAAAARLRRSVPEVAARLAAYGFAAADPALLPERVDRDDVMLVSRNLDGKAPSVDAGERVSLGRLVAAAARTGRSIKRMLPGWPRSASLDLIPLCCRNS